MTSPVSTFQIAGARSPRRSWPIASRWSPGIGDQAKAHRARPSSRRSATTAPGPRVEDPQRRVDQVAVLGVLDAQERLVGRQRALVRAGHQRVGAAELDRLLAVGERAAPAPPSSAT